MRCVPDVAALASCNFSPFEYFLGRRFPANGTSVSAPIWAGLCALINQARANHSLTPLGLLGPKIYPLNGTAAFNQMTTGSQSGGDGYSTTASNGAYAVGPNYNLVSGLGSPDISLLIAALMVAEPTTPAPTTPTPATPTTPTTPSPTTPTSSGGGGGGGGAPSEWFFIALGLILLARCKSKELVR
jgi:subtilase family serine protease